MIEPVPRMRHLDLREYEQSEPTRLSLEVRRALRDCLPSLSITPAPDSENAYILTPGATIGAVETEGLSVAIRPKLGIGRVLFLASCAMGAFRLRDRDRFDFRGRGHAGRGDGPWVCDGCQAGVRTRVAPRLQNGGGDSTRRPWASSYQRTGPAQVLRSCAD